MKEKEISLEERIEKIFESGWVNELNYLENLMQETRICLCKLQQELQRKDNVINELNKDLEYYKHEEELYRYYQQENPRLTNNWNELKEWTKKHFVGTLSDEFLDKIKELEESGKL